jgi:hypothetical protein
MKYYYFISSLLLFLKLKGFDLMWELVLKDEGIITKN